MILVTWQIRSTIQRLCRPRRILPSASTPVAPVIHFVGLNSFYGPWTQQVDLGLARRFKLTERQSITLQAQVFNITNHANYYVQNGTGVVATQYSAAPFGDNPDASTTCGDGSHLNQHCYLIPSAGFGTLQVINALNGPRVLQFAFKYSF